MEAALGQRVVRGPDWEWGDQDGGEGFVGTVAGLEEGGGGVIVQWDMGQRCRYRCGRDNKFDLRVLDDGPSGRSYSKHRCHVCRKKRVYGVVWRCLHCPEYYLCSVCYLANHHCSLHRFTCLLDRDGMQFRVPAREDSRCIPVSGLFYGAEVVRGTDWRWNDQDGGVGRTGKVVEVLDWSNEGGSGYERSVVLATWENGNKKKYRAGHKGKVDVRCIAPGSGGFYYPEHLPVLGRGVKPPSSGDIVTGDRIKCEVNLAELDDPEMAEKIGLMLDHVGTVNVLLENGELLVRYPGNSLVQVNPAAAKKVDVPMFESGDVVRMISDMAEVYRLQQGHGEWNDDMALCLDQVGKVIKTPGEVNVLVSIAGYRWTLNAHCLRHAPGETLTPGSDSNIALPLLGGLSLLLDSLGPSILIHAAARGDISTVQTFLERNPHQVNTMEQGKTAVHVAVEESRLKVLEVILKFKPDLSIMDGDGDSPLHTCAFLNATEAAPILLEAGADVNAKNAKRSVTPIMIAGAVGHYELLEIMAAHHSADINIQDSQGQTALHHVLSSQRTRAIPILLSAGANLTLLNSNLFTPLMEAAGHGSLPGVEDIVRQRPDLIDCQILADGITPLQLAGIKNRLFVVRHLALSGCDLNRKSGQHLRTALQATAIEGYVAVIECLVGFGCDVNLKDSDGNTALHIVFVNKCAQPLSDYTPQMNKVHEELSRLPLESVPRYLTLGCFLIQEGADPCARNNLGQTPAQTCPSDTRDILLNYVNKSNRGEFHGSLRRDRTSAASKTDNKPSVPNSSPRIISDSATISQQQSITAGSGGSRASGSRLGSGHGSIMDAQHQELGGGGGGGAGRLSQRERDRLRLQETKRKEVVTSESEEPRIPSAEEREQIRKHRQAYFASQDTKKKATASSSLTTRQEGRVTENQHTVKVVDTKRGEQQAASLGSPDTVESRHQTSKTRPQPSKTTPEATKLAEDEAKGSASKPTLRSSGANSVEDDSGKEQKRRENENSEQVQRKTVGTEERKKEKRQSQQKYSGSVSTVDTGKGTSFQPVTQPQFNAKDRASASVPCFVCERPANARLAPCGHNVACKTCARRAKRCPICKVLVTGVS